MFSDAGPDVRWIGNESGMAGDPCWSTVDPARVPYAGFAGPGVGDVAAARRPDGTVWRPGECDVSIRPGWFWHKDQDDKVRSVDNLVDLYFKSVGRNSLLLLNLPPNTDGLVSEPDVRAMAGFRERLEAIFKTDLAAGKPATASNTRDGDAAFGPQQAVDGKPETYWATDDDATAGWLEIDLGKPTEFNDRPARGAHHAGPARRGVPSRIPRRRPVEDDRRRHDDRPQEARPLRPRHRPARAAGDRQIAGLPIGQDVWAVLRGLLLADHGNTL